MAILAVVGHGRMFHFERVVHSLSWGLNWLGGCILVIMMSLTVVNVLVRPVYHAINGIPELISYSFVIVVCFGLAYTAVIGGHVSVGLLVSRLAPRVQAACDTIACLLGIGIFSVIAWRSTVYGWERWLSGEYAPVLEFPLLPFRYAVVFGCAVLCLVLLLNLLKSVIKAIKK